jgi:hypothetical protein
MSPECRGGCHPGYTDINMNKIENVIDVEEIVKEWQMSVPFINRGIKHPCA